LPGVTLVDIELEHAVKREKYVKEAWTYLARIRDICRKLDGDCRVFVFGSFVKGGFRSDSDIDVLVVTKLAVNPLSRGALFKTIASEVGYDSPFELHIVTEEEYLRVYRKLIDVLREVT